MKKFFVDISNRWKAIYLIWFIINFIMLLTLDDTFHYKKEFFPFPPTYNIEHLRGFDYQPAISTHITYDYSESLIYIVTPVVIYLVIKLWKKDE